MSWTAQHPDVTEASVFDVEVPETIADKPESLEQWQEALFAAQDIILSGVLGDPAKHRWSLNLGGHSNPGHEPTEGWATGLHQHLDFSEGLDTTHRIVLYCGSTVSL